VDVQEDETLADGYKLKLNSYDLGVDIELADAIQRIRFEHPEVRAVVVTSLKPRIFCAGANIYMLGTSSHAFKVNFCKFTNETRCAIEDDSRHSGRRYLAALNGTASGGGYELAIACNEIYLVDDGNSAVSLPEVPLLGVLPGTGGLTRLVDKRKVRRDRADVFSTLAEGLKGKRAKEWGLIDDYFPTSKFQESIAARVRALVEAGSEQKAERGIKLNPLQVETTTDGREYKYVSLKLNREKRYADLTVRAPGRDTPNSIAEIENLGDAYWPLRAYRELDDALLYLRVNELETGLVCLTSELNGSAFPMSNHLTRLQSRFLAHPEKAEEIFDHDGRFDTEEAEEAGLVTFAPDDLDWEDEVRVAIEERTSLSPDALTGMEA